MRIVQGNGNGHSSSRGATVSLDAPLPTVVARGCRYSGGTDQFILEPDASARNAPQTDRAKPPYRIPSMAEIRAVPDTGLRLVSTFSGAGGSCLGFAMAGYRTLWANEFIPAAADVYRLNHPDVILDTRSIREITGVEILTATGLAVGAIDVLEGSPPCASFSTAGKRQAHWGQVKNYSDGKERTDDLFFEFVRLLTELQPRTFVAENVSGLVKGAAKGYFKLILAAMKAAGYRVEARLLDAQWLGVPQARQRIIFVGVRLDLDRAPAFPKPLPYRYSVRDALPWIAAVEVAGPQFTPYMRTADRPSPTIVQSGNASFKQSPHTLVDALVEAPAGDGPTLRMPAHGWKDETTYNLAVQPCPTVVAAGLGSWGYNIEGASTPPTERRKFTIAELRRICGFPDDFILTGTYAQQWERLGRAVPPPMMAAVATALAKGVFDAG